MRKEWERQGDGGETIVRTCAWSPPGCHPVGCGLLLHVKDGKLVKVEGDPEHPITRGALCPRCLALKDYVYHPDRITHPMKRDPKDRGKDAWERITWEEAYDLICTKVNEVKENVRPGGHHGLRRHRPHRLHLLSHDRPQRVRHAQCVLRAKRHGLLLSSRHRNGLTSWEAAIPRSTTPAAIPTATTIPAGSRPQVHPGVGQGAAQVQSRRPVGAFRRRPHEAGLEGDLRRSARDVARLAGGHGPASCVPARTPPWPWPW